MDDAQKWFLMKHEDGTVFGPITFDLLRHWAVDAQVSPLDKVSMTEWLRRNRFDSPYLDWYAKWIKR